MEQLKKKMVDSKFADCHPYVLWKCVSYSSKYFKGCSHSRCDHLKQETEEEEGLFSGIMIIAFYSKMGDGIKWTFAAAAAAEKINWKAEINYYPIQIFSIERSI